MTDVYTYSKIKGDTNKPVNFSDSKNVVRIGIIPDEENEKLKPVLSD